MLTTEDINGGIRTAVINVRQALNISQADAGKHIGITRPQYVAKETGRYKFSAAELVQLSALFGCDTSYLIEGFKHWQDFAT